MRSATLCARCGAATCPRTPSESRNCFPVLRWLPAMITAFRAADFAIERVPGEMREKSCAHGPQRTAHHSHGGTELPHELLDEIDLDQFPTLAELVHANAGTSTGDILRLSPGHGIRVRASGDRRSSSPGEGRLGMRFSTSVARPKWTRNVVSTRCIRPARCFSRMLSILVGRRDGSGRVASGGRVRSRSISRRTGAAGLEQLN